MKTFMRITMFLAIASMAVMSCDKNDEDPRDKFIGSYSSTTTGTMTMTILSEKLEGEINEINNFTIEKLGGADKVVIKLGGESTECTVSGNNLSYSAPYVEEDDGMILSGTATVTGSISGNTLTLTYSIVGTISGDVSGTFSGTATEIATKR